MSGKIHNNWDDLPDEWRAAFEDEDEQSMKQDVSHEETETDHEFDYESDITDEYIQAPEDKEEKESRKNNRKDMIIIALAIVLFIGCGSGVFLYIRSQQPSVRLGRMIEEHDYSSAYQAIKEYSESGKNVDEQIYDFVDECVSNDKTKRAIAALKFLSYKAENNNSFFLDLYQTLLDEGKSNRAKDVLEFLDNRGGKFKTIADEIRETAS